ncbi:MAG: HlyD family efflux transporter periplasmic adaptor subunit [Bacteroidales bacterium]
MPNRDNFYSQETQDIMGTMPRWIIRWGITVVFVIFAGIIIGCYFIKYPQTVDAPVVITTINPPADLVARYEGKIDSIFVKDGQQVEAGTIIAILYNLADQAAVHAIEQHLKNTYNLPFKQIVGQNWFEQEYRMGDMQTAYSEFRRLCLDYRHYLQTDYITKKKHLLEQQISKSKIQYSQLLKQQQLYTKDWEYQKRGLGRDSMLYAEKVISALDFEKAQREKIQKENSKVGFEAGITSTELSIMQSQQQLIELSIQQDNELAEYERNLSQFRQQLLNQVNQWKEQYMLYTPITGNVTLVNYWSNNQRIKVGERLASVIPQEQMQVIGKMNIPSAGFGKVEKGQTVNVKLNGYPYMEFGVLKGKIKNISAVPDGTNGYIAEITFPDGLKTTYKKQLNLIQQMDGQGEIITKDMRLIQRYLQPIRALFDR